MYNAFLTLDSGRGIALRCMYICMVRFLLVLLTFGTVRDTAVTTDVMTAMVRLPSMPASMDLAQFQGTCNPVFNLF